MSSCSEEEIGEPDAESGDVILRIGASNATRRITRTEEMRIVGMVRREFDVIRHSVEPGRFRGVEEDCLSITVERRPNFGHKLGFLQDLRRHLRQEGIGVNFGCHYLRVVEETFLCAWSTMVIHIPTIVEAYPGARSDFLKAFPQFVEFGDLLVFTGHLHTFDGMCSRFLSLTIPHNIGRYFSAYDCVRSVGDPSELKAPPSWLAGSFFFGDGCAWVWLRNDETEFGAGCFVQRADRT